jgi:hypothetical protein
MSHEPTSISVDICLRGDNHATTVAIDGIVRAPSAWTDADVRAVLEGMLRAIDRLKRPGEADRPISLVGISWIVNAYEEGGVVIAIEITAGAAVAGPFDMPQAKLESMIARVLARPAAPMSPSVH